MKVSVHPYFLQHQSSLYIPSEVMKDVAVVIKIQGFYEEAHLTEHLFLDHDADI